MQCSATAATAGVFVAELTPVVASTHRIYVHLSHTDIRGSPFMLTVLPAGMHICISLYRHTDTNTHTRAHTHTGNVCGSKCSVSGAGLTSASVMPARNVFTIHARDEYGNLRPGLLQTHHSFYSRLVRFPCAKVY